MAAPAASVADATANMSSEMLHISSCGRRLASHRSNVDMANANETSAAPTAEAVCTVMPNPQARGGSIGGTRRPPGALQRRFRLRESMHDVTTMTAMPTGRRIPEATVARLPVYLRSLLEMAEAKT